MKAMNSNSKIILALDASSVNVGWCLAQGERYVDSGVYHPQGDANQRVREIACWAVRSINVHDPDLVAIEEPTGHHGNLKTDRLLARVMGCIEGICIIKGIPVELIHAMKVKATGFSKDTPRVAALLIGKTDVKPDEADAIGVWQATLSLLNLYHFMKQTS
jgi:Holliday junction resolvasome RuvABC endonuclease subunit